MKRFSCILLLIIVLFTSSTAFSQETKKVTLDECIQIALENNTSIVAAESYKKIARAGLRSAWGNFMPEINAHGNYSRKDQEMYNIRFDELVVSKESYYYQFSLSQPIFTGFRNLASLRQSKAEDKQFENSLSWTQQSVVLDVKLYYYNVLKAKQLLTVAEEALETSQEELKRIEAMEKIGTSSRAEVYQQKVRVGENKLAVIEARNNYISAKTDLNHKLGIDITTEIEVAPEDTDIKIEALSVNSNEAIAKAFKNRLDYKSVQNQLTQAKAGVKIQKSAYYPSVSLSASYSWWDVQFPQEKRDITEFDTYTLGLNISMNLFNGFKTRAGVNSAKAEVIAAEADLEQAKRQVALDVRKAILEIDRAAEKIQATEENVTSAEEDYRLASERFRIGAGTLLDQITAHTSLNRAKMEHIQAIYDYKYAVTVLELATGELEW